MKTLNVIFGSIAIGGIKTYIHEICHVLRDLGIEVDTLCGSTDNNKVSILNQNKEFCYSGLMPMIDAKQYGGKSAPTVESYRYGFELGAAYVGIEKYDLIHCHDAMSSCIIQRIRNNRTPIVVTFHGSLKQEVYLSCKKQNPDLTVSQYLDSFYGKYFQKIEQRAIQGAQAVLTTSDWMRKEIEADVFPPEKLYTISGGLRLQPYYEKQKTPFYGMVPCGKKVIAYVGRLESIKGVHVLIHALSQLKLTNTDWVCWIAGEGTLKAELKQLAVDLAIEKDIFFWGDVDNIPSFFNQVDIYVQPSLQDNQPLSVMEAQLAGIPVVLSDTTGLVEMVIQEKTGYLFPYGSSSCLARRLDYLIINEEIRKKVGYEACQWAKRYRCMDISGKKVAKLYEKIIAMSSK